MISLLFVLGIIIVILLFSIWLFTVLDIAGLNSIYIKWFVVIAFPLTIALTTVVAMKFIDNVQKDIEVYKENAMQIANSFVNAIGNNNMQEGTNVPKTYVNGDALYPTK